MRITKVYTRTGDDGTTRLVGGREISKGHLRLEAYGAVDELNATVGIVRTFNDRQPQPSTRLGEMLRHAQDDLFMLGSELATRPSDRWEGMRLTSDADIERLEAWIDELNAELSPLQEFILPGGGPVGAFFHLARTTCRRAERDAVRLIEVEPDTGTGALRYLNRLGDWLFVAGRYAAKSYGEEEYLWRR